MPNFDAFVKNAVGFLEIAVENPQSMVYAGCIDGPRRREPSRLSFTTRGGGPENRA